LPPMLEVQTYKQFMIDLDDQFAFSNNNKNGNKNMNKAAEFLVNWHLDRCDLEEDKLEVFIPALIRGYDAGEQDAVSLVKTYIELAVLNSRDKEDREIIDLMVRLHKVYEDTDQKIRHIDALVEIDKIVSDIKPGPFSDRISKGLINQIDQKLKAHVPKVL
jgi:hypothetical protein